MDVSEDSNASDPADLSEPQQSNVDVPSAQASMDINEPPAETVPIPTLMETELEQDDIIDGNDDEELNEKKSKTAGGFTGRGVTLQMLLEDNILQAKDGAMSLEYMGQKFNGDLLADGKIFSAEVQEVFSSPSAWALRCKKIVNPEQKYGCGWSSVRYCGRPLDVYKNQWMKKRRLDQVNESLVADECNTPTNDSLALDPEPESCFNLVSSNQNIVKHDTLGNRSSIDDSNILVETVSFAAAGKLQPFLVSLNTAALVVMDVHCSLTRSEVVGYLAGLWDMNGNTLTVKQAFPCLSRLADETRGQAIEHKIAQSIEAAGLSLIGWYHSHPVAPPTPTVQDIDAQLDYQLKLKGTGEHGYRPCIGMISSPFYHGDSTESSSELSQLTCYWVSPPPESRPLEVGRPMAMQYNVVYDSSIKEDVLPKLEACLNFYKDAPDHFNFDDKWAEGVTLLDKLKTSVKSSLQNDEDAVILDLLDESLDATRKIKREKKEVTAEILQARESESPVNLTAIACI